MFLLIASLSFALAAAPVDAPAPGLPRLLVLDFAAAGVPAETASALTEAAASEVGARGFFQVITSRDLQTLIGLERQRQLVGCNSDSSCIAELGDALGAKMVLSGSVSRLGPNLQLTMQALDSVRAQPVGRVTRIAKDVEPIRLALPYALSEVLGIPQPTPPSRVLPYSLMGAGAAAVLAGAGVGVVAFAQEEAFLRELELGSRQNGILGTAESYRQESGRIGTLKTVALGSAILGVGLAAAGFFLNPPALAEGTSSRVAITTDGSTTGFVFSGEW